MEENLPVSYDHRRHSVHMGHLFPLDPGWVFLWIPKDSCLAEISKRAKITEGLLGHTDRGAEIHQRLVEGVSLLFWNEGFRKVPEALLGSAFCGIV